MNANRVSRFICNVCQELNLIYLLTISGAGGMVSGDDQVVTARKVGEVMQTTINTLGTAVSYPLGEYHRKWKNVPCICVCPFQQY